MIVSTRELMQQLDEPCLIERVSSFHQSKLLCIYDGSNHALRRLRRMSLTLKSLNCFLCRNRSSTILVHVIHEIQSAPGLI